MLAGPRRLVNFMWSCVYIYVCVYIYMRVCVYIYIYIYIYACIYIYIHTYWQVPDGKYTLYLYQTESISDVVDETTVSSIYKIEDVSGIPDRDDSISDFYYG